MILGVVVAVLLLLPHTAWATCVIEPFDQVVRSSDVVLVAKIADARPAGRGRGGIIVRLAVEQVLKGSAKDGRQVSISSCGPVMTGPMTKKAAAQAMVGTRTLFLLTKSRDGVFAQYPEITTPQMSLDQKIARARQVLGLPTPAWTDRAIQHPNVRDVVVLIAGLVLIVGVILVARRLRRSGQDLPAT